MRRRVALTAVLLTVAALAVPAAAAPPGETGEIRGVVTDSTTGAPFDLDGAEMLVVDVFNTATFARRAVYLSNSDDGKYAFTNLPAGNYKVRFRYFNGSLDLAGYRWNTDKANFDLADPVSVPGGASLTLNATLKPIRGAAVSGTLTDRGTGAPLTSALCYSVHLFEASGIALGWVPSPDASGDWSISRVPAGQWAALATYSTYDPSCGTSPAHLDTWWGGASGWPIYQGLVADKRTFPSADILTVVKGVPVTDIDIAMPPAPTCKGKVPTIFGTTLTDTIIGTAGRDIISGLAGNDTIKGLGGNDLLCGDAGNDTLIGGAGLRDTAVGGPGKDDCTAETRIGCELPLP